MGIHRTTNCFQKFKPLFCFNIRNRSYLGKKDDRFTIAGSYYLTSIRMVTVESEENFTHQTKASLLKRRSCSMKILKFRNLILEIGECNMYDKVHKLTR